MRIGVLKRVRFRPKWSGVKEDEHCVFENYTQVSFYEWKSFFLILLHLRCKKMCLSNWLEEILCTKNSYID